MLSEQFKNKDDEQKAIKLWNNFADKNGHKYITSENFLERGYTYCSYKINKRYYQGYFRQDEIDLIFKVLDYYNGKIRALSG